MYYHERNQIATSQEEQLNPFDQHDHQVLPACMSQIKINNMEWKEIKNKKIQHKTKASPYPESKIEHMSTRMVWSY